VVAVSFVCEGRKRNSRYKDGKFADMLIYSILKSEFFFGGGAEQIIIISLNGASIRQRTVLKLVQ
jgi:hypothetical protein